jgi:hypothetical protein
MIAARLALGIMLLEVAGHFLDRQRALLDRRILHDRFDAEDQPGDAEDRQRDRENQREPTVNLEIPSFQHRALLCSVPLGYAGGRKAQVNFCNATSINLA